MRQPVGALGKEQTIFLNKARRMFPLRLLRSTALSMIVGKAARVIFGERLLFQG